MRLPRRAGAFAMTLTMVLAVAGCTASKTAVSFKGHAAEPSGKSVPVFVLSIARGTAPAQSVNVTTKNGRYEVSVLVAGPTPASSSRVLGTSAEMVILQASAPGHKSKTFKVTADQIRVGEANALNVVLEPTS